MDAATKQWLEDLKTSGSVSDDDMNVLTKIANNPKADEFIKGSALRQADYSRKMQELKTLAEAHAVKESEVTKFQTDLATWKVGAEKNYQKALQEREELATKFTAAQERLKTFATLHNVSEEELGTLATEPVVKKPVEAPKYVREEELAEYMKRAVGESSLLDAAVHDLSIRHQELFGTPLKNSVAFMKEAITSPLGVTGFFNDKFKVAERLEVLRKEDVDKQIKAAVDANEAKLRSELQISTPRAGDRSSPLFDTTNFHPKQDGTGRTMSAVEAATQAYNKGTYQVK